MLGDADDATDIPTEGCWEIVGRVGEIELRFVVDVLLKLQNPPLTIMTYTNTRECADGLLMR